MEKKGLKITSIHFTDAMKMLDHARIDGTVVNVEVYTQKGELRKLRHWLVRSSWGRGGTHKFYNPVSKQTREFNDILIMKVNDLSVRL